MDILSDYLKTFDLNAHVFLHSNFFGSWAVDTSGERKATFHMIARGAAWLHLPDSDTPIALRSGDIVVFPNDAAHTISNSESPPPPEQPRNQPNNAKDKGPVTSLICGYFTFERHHWNPLLNALPEVMVIKSEDTANTALMDDVIRNIIYETETEGAGSDVIVDKLSEVLFIHVVRTHMQQQQTNTGFIAALADKQISAALSSFHAMPGDSWSVESLSNIAGMSRSVFAEKFHKLVMMPPMAYVTCWRMQIAYGHLSEAKESVAQVAEQSGYQSEAAFAKVFKKHFGYGPGKVRKSN
ncbi:MAG: AraC family transcriptional regulator [Porticoccus sp.]|nr:AraC family transcriptional regulator [Porticoccus sp.]